jgi:hypothetical protein
MKSSVLVLLAPLVASSPTPKEAPTHLKFSELTEARPARFVVVHLAPLAVVSKGKRGSGEMYPEPCDPKDPAIGANGRAHPALHIVGIPPAEATRLNAIANTETERGKTWTCFDVELQLVPHRAKRATQVEGTFVHAEERGSRPVDRGLLAGD